MKFDKSQDNIEEDEIYRATLDGKVVIGSEKYLKLIYCLKNTLKTNRDLFNYFKKRYCRSKDNTFDKVKYLTMIEYIHTHNNQLFEKLFEEECKDLKLSKSLLREALEQKNMELISFILNIFMETTSKLKDKEIARIKYIASFSDILCSTEIRIVNLVVNIVKIKSIEMYINILIGKIAPSVLPKNSSIKYFIRGVSNIKIIKSLEENYSSDIDKYLGVMILYPINRRDRELLDYYLERLKKFSKKSKEEIFINMFYACRDVETFKYILIRQKELSVSINKNKFKYSKFVCPYLYDLLMKQ